MTVLYQQLMKNTRSRVCYRRCQLPNGPLTTAPPTSVCAARAYIIPLFADRLTVTVNIEVWIDQ